MATYNPYEYQERGTEWIIDHPACLLALDMGLGKSVITLTAIQRLLDYFEISRVLVVAPKKVAETTWTSEARKWDHLRALRVEVVLGTMKQRLKALATPADVYVTSRDLFAWLVGHYGGSLPFDMLVIDELTSFKSHTSQRFKALRMVRPGIQRCVGLTGTPAPNGYKDLWAQMYCIDMGERLGRSFTGFRHQYFSTVEVNHIPIRFTPLPGATDRIRDLIGDITLTMQARDYLTLPDMLVHTVRVEYSKEIREKYANFEREKVMEFKESADSIPKQLIAGSAAALMNKLAQFSNGAIYDDDRNVHEIHAEKLQHLVELVEGAGSPVLVFYQFKHDIPRIRAHLKGYRTEVYSDARQLEEWNAGRIDVLLAHPASTAYGLNMQQGGHYIVWFGTGWDLELYLQANARLHRQGQTHPVTVYRLIGAGTVDERAAAALDSKGTMQQGLLDSLSDLMKKYSK